ncbi:phage tail family protein, partial [Lactiplantibacillus plantarum]
MSSIVIQKMDGTIYDLDKLGIHVISFDPPGSNYQHTFTQMSEYSTVLTDTQMQQTTIPLVF